MKADRITSKKGHERHYLMHVAAYVTAVGTAGAEVLDMKSGTRLALTLGLFALFTAILVVTLHVVYMRKQGPFLISVVALSIIDFAVMLVGASPQYGAVLFFVVCTIVAMRMSLTIALIWNGAAVLGFLASMIIRGEQYWGSGVLTFGAGFFAFVAFTYAYRKSQQARAESEHLLEELASAQGRLRDLAIMEERQRLAREMHDAVGHRLTVSAVLLEGAARLIATEPERATRMVATSREQVREGLAELRAAVTALREDMSEGQGLREVLAALVDVYSQATDARVTLSVAPELIEPDPERKMVLIRTAQEALTNVQKHSGATRVDVTLQQANNAYVLSCSDNGRGVPRESALGESRGSGFGLGNLKTRAASFGGIVVLEPGPDGGAVLRLTLPGGGATSYD